jgi:hypothetical protein
VGTAVVGPDVLVEVFELGVVVVVVVFDVGGDGDAGVVVVVVVVVFDVVGNGDAGAVVVGGAGLKAISALNSRPIDSAMVSVRAAGMAVHVDV